VTAAGPPAVRWGFIGAGFVATQALAPAVHAGSLAVLQAAAAREQRRADALEPVGFSSTDYRHVLNHEDVDVVYISLTNDVHLEWILEALDSGKHVVCEKPLTLNAGQAQAAFDAARAADRLLVEAAWTQWHPRTRRLDGLIGEGTLGGIRQITAEFTFEGVPPGNYRRDAARGGGALLDVGTRAVLVSDGGAEAHVLASFLDPEHQALRLLTESAQVTLSAPAFTSWRQPCSLELQEGGRVWSETFATCDAYEVMVNDVSRRILGDPDSFVVGAEETLRCLRVMDLIDSAVHPS
jgi:xylose dehydrogenase (NAD/NADP)